MKLLWSLAGLSLIIQISSQAFAGIELDGFVCKTKDKRPGIRISKTTAPCDPAQFVDSIAQDDYRSLHLSDWVSFTGAVYGVPIKVEVESISTVGLNRILGKWTDGFGSTYSFYTYDLMTILGPGPVKKYRTLGYELFPNFRNAWLVSITEGNQVISGSLQYYFENKQPRIEFCEDATNVAAAKCVTLQRP